MGKKIIELIPNSWHKEFDEWFSTLQKERKENYNNEKKTALSNSMSPLYLRNWGHINSQFTFHFFELLEKLKYKDANLYNEFINKANISLLFFEFNTDLSMKEYIEKYVTDKHK